MEPKAPLLRLSIVVCLSLMTVAVSSPVRAQHYNITVNPTINPLSGIKLIGGTKFPWTDRSGNISKLSQGFTVNGPQGFHADTYTVKVNGNLCPIVSDMTDPRKGTWTHSSPTISVPNAAQIFTLTVQYYFPDGTPVPNNQGNPLPINYWAYKVESIAGGVDEVQETNNLFFAGVTLSTAGGGLNARSITSLFRVTAPPEAQGSFAGIQVGIVQTAPTITPGAIAYHRTVPADNRAATVSEVLAKPTPCFDALGADQGVWPFYTAASVRTGPNLGAGNNEWTNAGDLIKLDDKPSESYGVIINPPADPNATYDWGSIMNNKRYRDGTLTHIDFEDTLVAVSTTFTRGYVPVYPFNGWDFSYTGYLDLASMSWVGGSVTLIGGLLNVPEISKHLEISTAPLVPQ